MVGAREGFSMAAAGCVEVNRDGPVLIAEIQWRGAALHSLYSERYAASLKGEFLPMRTSHKF